MSFNPSLITVAAVALSVASPAAATGFDTVAIVTLNHSNSHLRYEDKPSPQKISGSLANDLGHEISGWKSAYSLEASASGLSTAIRSSGHVPNTDGRLFVNEVDLQTLVRDTIAIKGSSPGQRLAWHRSMKIGGNSEFNGDIGAGASSFYQSLYDFTIFSVGDFDIDPGPYLGFGGQGIPTFATGTHFASHVGAGRPLDIVRVPQSILDYTMYVTVGQESSFTFGINLFSGTILNSEASVALTQQFNVNFDTGPGFFTLVGNDGRDTGVRFDPHLDPNFDISSASGFNYLASAGARGGAVPEPVSWALMLAGFGTTGGAMRMSKRKTRTSCC